jgi:hypothetical protein
MLFKRPYVLNSSLYRETAGPVPAKPQRKKLHGRTFFCKFGSIHIRLRLPAGSAWRMTPPRRIDAGRQVPSLQGKVVNRKGIADKRESTEGKERRKRQNGPVPKKETEPAGKEGRASARQKKMLRV